ncbi:MAG: hypothetical protein ACI841_000665 [Planctomycetota bacterium]|jgi:hypothetical protein
MPLRHEASRKLEGILDALPSVFTEGSQQSLRVSVIGMNPQLAARASEGI